MALIPYQKPTKTGIGAPFVKQGYEFVPSPFFVRINSVNDITRKLTVEISPHSVVMDTPDVINSLFIIGLGFPFEIQKGDKIWLETFHDRDLEPVFARISYGKKWGAANINPISSQPNTKIYPSRLEFITPLDLDNRIELLESIVDGMGSYKAAVLANYDNKVVIGELTEERAAILQDDISDQIDAATDLIEDYRNNFSAFFEFSTQTLGRKMFRTYTLVAYTTEDLASVSLPTRKITFPPQATTNSQNVSTEAPIESFNLVQCLNSDLLLVDYCHDNKYAAKLPVGCPKPVYPYLDEDGDLENEAN